MASIDSYETKSGKRWMVQYRTPDRRLTKKRGFKTKRDATAWMNSMEVDKLQGGFINQNAGRITVADIGKVWKSSLISDSESWKSRQLSSWETHVLPYWGRHYVGNIKTSDVQDWVNLLCSPEREPSPLSAKSIRIAKGVLASVLDRAVDERRLLVNPAREKIRLPRQEVKDRPFLTVEQVHALVDEVPGKYVTITWVLITSGMRWGEMAALRPRDILADSRLRLARAYSKSNSKSVLTDLKGHEARTVIVPPNVHEMVCGEAAGRGWGELIWEAPRRGGPLRPPITGHWLDGAVKRCHVRDETFPAALPVHSLRHTAASLMISSGAHIKTIQRQLGHKSAAMTLDQYGHLMEDDLDVVAKGMGSLLF
ncbi:MAG: tyrosine-type recombinase/integrase, partial [Corynebacterium casei]|uniref:tyrosine-type recombinase/integrase n=1 Tax=Corynebacterium casei TaxID=160386 RepID=UPI003F9E7BD0